MYLIFDTIVERQGSRFVKKKVLYTGIYLGKQKRLNFKDVFLYATFLIKFES